MSFVSKHTCIGLEIWCGKPPVDSLAGQRGTNLSANN